MTIKNILFDVGNVIVKWSPMQIIQSTFPDFSAQGQQDLLDKLFKSPLWLQLNLGQLTEEEIKSIWVTEIADIDKLSANRLFDQIKSSQTLIPGTTDLIQTLHLNGYRLFALTDNVKEIVSYLQVKYDFWQYFIHTTVSAEVGLLKPSKEIFEHALKTNQLNATETLFIDDHPPNLEGAKAVGLATILFTDAQSCRRALNQHGVLCDEA